MATTTKCRPAWVSGRRSSSRANLRSVEPTEVALDHPATRQQHETLLRLAQFDDLHFDAFVMRRLSSRFTGIALVSECEFHRLTGCLLKLARKLCHLRPLLLVGRRELYRVQKAQCADSHVDFGASFALMTVVTRTRSALSGGLQRSPVQNHGTRLVLTRLRAPNYRT